MRASQSTYGSHLTLIIALRLDVRNHKVRAGVAQKAVGDGSGGSTRRAKQLNAAGEDDYESARVPYEEKASVKFSNFHIERLSMRSSALKRADERSPRSISRSPRSDLQYKRAV